MSEQVAAIQRNPPSNGEVIAGFLTFFAWALIVLMPSAGAIIIATFGIAGAVAGTVLIVSGVIGGLMMMGFASIVENVAHMRLHQERGSANSN